MHVERWEPRRLTSLTHSVPSTYRSISVSVSERRPSAEILGNFFKTRLATFALGLVAYSQFLTLLRHRDVTLENLKK